MDVLIKNVEKPKNCLECQFYLSEYDYCHALKDNLSQKEWETKSRCPLVELPPHGDLIERSKVHEAITQAYCLEDVPSIIDQLVPTVLEANT